MLAVMRQALEVMNHQVFRVYADFIEGEKKTVTVSLSRGLPDRAMPIAEVHFGTEAQHEKEPGYKFTNWAEYLVKGRQIASVDAACQRRDGRCGGVFPKAPHVQKHSERDAGRRPRVWRQRDRLRQRPRLRRPRRLVQVLTLAFM